MLYVDDAGWGSPVGGTLIAAFRPETSEFHVEEIPVVFFQAPLFEAKAYLNVSADKAEDAVRALHPGPGEPIHICQGYIHTETHRRHPHWKITKIEGPFQAKIEQALVAYLNGLGFPYKGSSEQYGKLFYESIKWLKGGNMNRRGMDSEREKLGKSGWLTWSAYRNHPYSIAKQVAADLKRAQRRSRWNRGGGYDEY